MPSPLHRPLDHLSRLAVAHIEQRIATGAPVGRAPTPHDVRRALDTVGLRGVPAMGRGLDAAWRGFLDAVDSNTVGLDSARFLAFVPMAPSTASIWMDAVVGASSYSAESWLEAAGAVAAENEVIAFLADLAGMPSTAGGCFVSGGSLGNLSALAVARDHRPGRRTVAMADTAHASVRNALHLLGLRALVVPTDGVLTGEAVRRAVDGAGAGPDLAAVVASAGSTNAGRIDDLVTLADECERLGAWFHVDGAYGGAAMLLPELRHRFTGVERCDSFIVDPHKWLFATAGSCALVYREPQRARSVHTQHGPYIDVLHGDDEANPSDLGFQLTRRASGLPLWFALQVHGVDAHADAVRQGIALAQRAASVLGDVPGVEVLGEPELSVVLFRRAGWGRAEWADWARRLLADGTAFVAPTTWRDEPVGRLVFLHPDTPVEVIDRIAESLGD